MAQLEKLCPFCKNKIADGSKFCNNCGKPLMVAVTFKKSKIILRFVLSILTTVDMLLGLLVFSAGVTTKDFTLLLLGIFTFVMGILAFLSLRKQAKNDEAFIKQVQEANLELLKNKGECK